MSGRFSTLDTVPSDTPARAATSLTLGRGICGAPSRAGWGALLQSSCNDSGYGAEPATASGHQVAAVPGGRVRAAVVALVLHPAGDPFQLFRILVEVIRGGGYGPDGDVALMLDQCHNIEKKVPGQIRSVLNVQEMTARALLLDTDALAAAQDDGDVLRANQAFMDAFYTDVRRDLAGWREQRGLPADPLSAYLASGYQEQIEADRVGGTQAGWS